MRTYSVHNYVNLSQQQQSDVKIGRNSRTNSYLLRVYGLTSLNTDMMHFKLSCIFRKDSAITEKLIYTKLKNIISVACKNLELLYRVAQQKPHISESW